MLGFYGAGNMATAILRGVLSSGLLSANEIAAYDLDGGKTAALAAKTGITAASSPAASVTGLRFSPSAVISASR